MVSNHPATLAEIKSWKEEVNRVDYRFFGYREEPLITSNKRLEIEDGIKSFIDDIRQQTPNWEKELTDNGLPPDCIKWYKGLDNYLPVFHKFIDQHLRKLTSNDIKVLLAVGRFKPISGKGNRGDGSCWPSRKTIAELAGVSEDNVWRSLKRLRVMGFLITVKRGWNIVFRKIDQMPEPRPTPKKKPTLKVVQDDFERRSYK